MAKKFSFDKNLKITVNTFKDVLKDFNDHFKNKQKSTEEYEVMSFWCVTIIYSESLFNTLYIEIKHKC